MSITCVQTETVVEDRLACPPMPINKPPKAPLTVGGKALLRSKSFNMLRQFPAYLCRRGSSDVLHWIYDSRTKLARSISLYHKQAQRLLLVVGIWSCLACLCLQVCCCLTALASSTVPIGFLFMVSCIIIMTTMAALIAFQAPAHGSRTRR